jgi:hypothetical protein
MAVQRRKIPDHGASVDAEALVRQLQALQIAFDTTIYSTMFPRAFTEPPPTEP